MHFTI